jgi:GT2 family glycosyltransferase
VKISVVIPTHNRSDALAKTLLNLSKQQFADPWEVIVVNNRSTDDTDDVVSGMRFPSPLRLVHEEKPGVAAARNTGITVARGQYIILVDNDILVEPDFLRRHYELLLSNPCCWITGQVVNLPEQRATPFGKYRQSLCESGPGESNGGEVYWLNGGNVSLPRSDWERLGGFDERFSGASVEDYDFAIRARDAGIKILFRPSIAVIHNDWAGFSIEDYCRRQRLYTRSEPLFWKKYGDRHVRMSLVRQNLPPDWTRDNPVIFAKKLVKKTLATKNRQAILSAVCAFLERNWTWPPLLHRLYTLMLAVAIYQGFQDGLKIHNIDCSAPYGYLDNHR